MEPNELEQNFIEQRKPYLQYNCYSKYDSAYRGFDLEIFVTYRRRAFVVARDGKYTEKKYELLVDRILDLNKNIDFSDYRSIVPSMNYIALVEKEMPKGSAIWSQIKSVVEKNIGIESIRGCQYPYLVRLVAAVLEATSKSECAVTVD